MSDSRQLLLNLLPESDWVLPPWPVASQTPLAVDLETKDPTLKDRGPGFLFGEGHPIGFAVANETGAIYVPDPGPRDYDRLAWLAAAADEIVFHNASYDLGWLPFHIPPDKVRDTLVAEALLDENRFSYSLDSIAKDRSLPGKDEARLRKAASLLGVDPKAEMWRLPPGYVGPYAQQDAVITLKLWGKQKALLEEEELMELFLMECRLIPTFLAMTRKGIRLDCNKAAMMHETANEIVKAGCRQLRISSPWSRRDVAKLIGCSPQDPMDKHTLSQTKEGQAILNLRVHDKNAQFLLSVLQKQHKGRLHPQYHQTRRDEGGTVSGRISSSHPNIQQQPPKTRCIYLPEEGDTWAKFDYSGQEPLFWVHYALKLGYRQAWEAKKAIERGEKLYNLLVNKSDNQLSYKEAKICGLARGYGMGPAKMSHTYGFTIEEAERLLEYFDQTAPYVQNTARSAQRLAEDRGYIKTILGRRCRFNTFVDPMGSVYCAPQPKHLRDKRLYTYKAFNRLIQGSSADQTKKAMLSLVESGFEPYLRIQVHDELNFSIHKKALKDIKDIKEVMETCMGDALLVQPSVSVETGESWK